MHNWTPFNSLAWDGTVEKRIWGGGHEGILADYPTLVEGSRDWAIITPKWSSVQPAERVNEAW